jgi:hypothetical protein
MKTYTVIAKGNFGPAHPLHDPRVHVTLFVDGEKTGYCLCESGMEGHRWALEQGHVLPLDHHLNSSQKYQDLLAEVRYRRAGL